MSTPETTYERAQTRSKASKAQQGARAAGRQEPLGLDLKPDDAVDVRLAVGAVVAHHEAVVVEHIRGALVAVHLPRAHARRDQEKSTHGRRLTQDRGTTQRGSGKVTHPVAYEAQRYAFRVFNCFVRVGHHQGHVIQNPATSKDPNLKTTTPYISI
jgi:hypothetical protein